MKDYDFGNCAFLCCTEKRCNVKSINLRRDKFNKVDLAMRICFFVTRFDKISIFLQIEIMTRNCQCDFVSLILQLISLYSYQLNVSCHLTSMNNLNRSQSWLINLPTIMSICEHKLLTFPTSIPQTCPNFAHSVKASLLSASVSNHNNTPLSMSNV